MNRLSFISVIVLVLSFLTPSIKTQQISDRQILFPIENSESNTINKFAWELFMQTKTNPLSNFILCPLAVQYQLLLLEMAANGETKEQLRNVAGGKNTNLKEIYNLMNSGEVDVSKVHSANGIFLNMRLKLNASFQLAVEKELGEIYNVDFYSKPVETKKSINQWISLNTNGTIEEFLSNDFDVSSLEMLLASALYFHGQWQHKFKNTTHRGQFFIDSDKVFIAEYMEIVQNFNFERTKLSDGMGMELIEMPYKGKDYSMILLVPNRNTPLDIALKQINVEGFNKIMKSNNDRNSIRIRLIMPKFQISSRVSVVNALLKMGLTNVFSKLSNLPYLTENSEPLAVSDILQQSTLNVDESGTVASAATTSFIVPLSADNKHEVTIDRPFVAIIFDRKNQCPLFLSKIMQPTAQ